MAKFTVEAFVEKAKNSHGNRYDYSKVTARAVQSALLMYQYNS